MESLSAYDLIAFFDMLADAMQAHQDELRELDAQIGDGDLGITVSLGMKGIKAALPGLADEEPGKIIARCGMVFNQSAASTFGAIFASGMMRAGKVVMGRAELGLADFGDMLAAAAEGIMQRGGAKPGEKTVLDVLIPMAEAIEGAAASGSSLADGIGAAHKACMAGLEATVEMKGRHGRSGWMQEKSIGVQDPGSTAICLMVQYLKEFVAQ